MKKTGATDKKWMDYLTYQFSVFFGQFLNVRKRDNGYLG
jgi:hypothetical protein